MQPRRLNYKLMHCSSEEIDYPVTELLLQSPEARGWQSKKFAEYPQIIVLQLEASSMLRKVAVLCHQSKIPTRMEIQTKLQEEEQWKRLGRISFDQNLNTNFKAREFKQANLNGTAARFLRLTFKDHYINKHNLFNQVSIISFSLYGEAYEPKKNNQLKPQRIIQETQNIDRNGESVDPAIAKRLSQLEMRKNNAVKNEDFQIAGQIKTEIDRIKSLSLTISALESKKSIAVKSEDYESAAIINNKIKQLKQQLHANTNQKDRQEDKRKKINNEVKQQTREIKQAPPRQQTRQNKTSKEGKESYKQIPPPQDQKMSYLQKPITVKNANPYTEAEDQFAPKREQSLQPLPKVIYGECSQYFSVISEQIFEHIFSASPSLRQQGLEMCLELLKDTQDEKEFLAAALYVVSKTADDKVPGVVTAALELFNGTLQHLKPQSTAQHMLLIQAILTAFAEHLGHNNERLRSLVQDSYGNFPIYNLTSNEICVRILIAPSKRERPPRMTQGRLRTLARIVINYRMIKDYEQMLKYAAKYADDKNNEIRSSAVQLLVQIARKLGDQSIRPYISKLRPAIVKAIEEQLGSKEETGEREEQFQEQGNQFIQVRSDMCEFCGLVDKNFNNEDYLNMHHFHACPMLTICKECNQAVEISTLTAHMLSQCKNSKYFKRCPRCKEAVSQKNYKSHVEAKECLSAKPLASANRCPLCHLDIPSSAAGWKTHLVQQGCDNNPRK